MNLRNLIVTAFFASSIAGCGSNDTAITDPGKLKPLTDAEKAEVKKQDEQVQDSESKVFDTKAKTAK